MNATSALLALIVLMGIKPNRQQNVVWDITVSRDLQLLNLQMASTVASVSLDTSVLKVVHIRRRVKRERTIMSLERGPV